MTMLVGIAPDGPGKAVLHLAGMLARSGGDDLLLCSVVPQSWPPGPAKVDAEYQAHLDSTATEVLERARGRLAADITSRLLVQHARSAPAGLVEAAEQHDARMIVVGSSSAGAFGHVSLGSVSGRLLHSSPVPVALTPRGHRCQAGSRVERVTAAFSGPEGADLVVAAAAVAAQVGASLRIASFAVRSRPPYTSGVGSSGEQAILRQWSEEIEAAAGAALEKVADLAAVPRDLGTVVGRGESWGEAIDDVEWQTGDVLVVGSSSVGPVARVFLGSRATKIVQHSPVPVVLVPRGRAAALADEALHAESA
jgi:nucleotide-binding universal stress UspA family protein